MTLLSHFCDSVELVGRRREPLHKVPPGYLSRAVNRDNGTHCPAKQQLALSEQPSEEEDRRLERLVKGVIVRQELYDLSYYSKEVDFSHKALSRRELR